MPRQAAIDGDIRTRMLLGGTSCVSGGFLVRCLGAYPTGRLLLIGTQCSSCPSRRHTVLLRNRLYMIICLGTECYLGSLPAVSKRSSTSRKQIVFQESVKLECSTRRNIRSVGASVGKPSNTMYMEAFESRPIWIRRPSLDVIATQRSPL